MVSFAAQDASVACIGFAAEVGGVDAGPVRIVGGGTHSMGTLTGAAAMRSVRAPAGVVWVEPEELIVRCGAGTTWAELDDALTSAGLVCPLDPIDSRSTVGGVLSMGFSGIRRSRYGHIRDLLLETRYVSAQGILVKAGAPVVKNVTGYDLCRLLVGSHGTLGFLSEVVLRCRPRPAEQVWLRCAGADPFAARASLVTPGAVLWNGTYTYVLLEGTASEVRVGRQTLGGRWGSSSAPQLQGFGIRRALRNSTIRTMAKRLDKGLRPSGVSTHGADASTRVLESSALTDLASSSSPTSTSSFGFETDGANRAGELAAPVSASGSEVLAFWAEIGVGTVHFSSAVAASTFDSAQLSPPVLALNQQLKAAFDPTGRLNPGVKPW